MFAGVEGKARNTRKERARQKGIQLLSLITTVPRPVQSPWSTHVHPNKGPAVLIRKLNSRFQCNVDLVLAVPFSYRGVPASNQCQHVGIQQLIETPGTCKLTDVIMYPMERIRSFLVLEFVHKTATKGRSN